MTSCASCGRYSFRGKRHPACAPAYLRARVFTCEVCGKMARGRRHRLCSAPPPVGYRSCGYCGGVTRGAFHKRCQPDSYEYRVFADMPEIVQRKCMACAEWFPFASIAPSEVDVALEWWAPHGAAASGRPRYDGRCRACLSERRREYEREYARRVAA